MIHGTDTFTFFMTWVIFTLRKFLDPAPNKPQIPKKNPSMNPTSI